MYLVLNLSVSRLKMPTSPRDILNLAKYLCANEPNEAFTRSTVSRAYYAALLEADATFEKATRMGDESSHAVIIAGAKNYGVGANPGREAALNIAKILPRMRRERNTADYHLAETVTLATANEALERAEAVLAKCDEVRERRLKAGAAMAMQA